MSPATHASKTALVSMSRRLNKMQIKFDWYANQSKKVVNKIPSSLLVAWLLPTHERLGLKMTLPGFKRTATSQLFNIWSGIQLLKSIAGNKHISSDFP